MAQGVAPVRMENGAEQSGAQEVIIVGEQKAIRTQTENNSTW